MSRIINSSSWNNLDSEGPAVATFLVDYYLDGITRGWASYFERMIAQLDNEGGKMAVIPEMVSVSDLFAVYPELAGFCEGHASFAERIRLAADLARKEDALVELRDRLEPIRSEGWDAGFEAAFGDATEEGAGKDES